MPLWKPLLVGLAVLLPSDTEAQAIEWAPPERPVLGWLEQAGLGTESAGIVARARLGTEAEAVIVAEDRYGPFILLVVPADPSMPVWKLADVPGQPDPPGPGIVYADRDRLVLRSVYSYGRQGFTPFELDLEAAKATRGEEFGAPAATTTWLESDTLHVVYARQAGPTDLLVRHPLGADRSQVSEIRPGESVVPRPGEEAPRLRATPRGVVIGSGSPDTVFVPVDLPDTDTFRSLRPDRYPGASVDIEVELGPTIRLEEEIWSGLTFYDGEGYSGVGGLIRLDRYGRYGEVLHPDELVDWSISALHWDGTRLVFARLRRPEGFDFGGGLGFYDPESGEVDLVDVPGVIGAITSGERTIYAASSSGVYMVRGTVVEQFKLVPQPSGWALVRFPPAPGS